MGNNPGLGNKSAAEPLLKGAFDDFLSWNSLHFICGLRIILLAWQPHFFSQERDENLWDESSLHPDVAVCTHARSVAKNIYLYLYTCRRICTCKNQVGNALPTSSI